MEKQYLLAVLAILLAFDFLRPYLFTGPQLEEKVSGETLQSDKPEMSDGLKELISMSQGGRVFISYCTS